MLHFLWSRVEPPIRAWMHRLHAWVGWPFQRWFESRALGGRWVFEKTTPNFWSLIRFPLAIILGLLLSSDHDGWALIIFGLALVTDRIDGELARAQKKVTTLGMILDTVADALFLSAMLLGLAHRFAQPAYPKFIVGLESLRLVGALIIWMLPHWDGRRQGLEPNMSGKYKTAMIGAALIMQFMYRDRWASNCMLAAIVFSLWSMGRHLYDLARQPRLRIVPPRSQSGSEPPLAS